MVRATATVAAILAASFSVADAQTSLGVPNTGNAPPSGSPVQIEDCVASGIGGALLAKSNRRFKVVFTNEGKVSADLIRFRIDFGEESLAIRDAGTFAPGVTVTHVFRNRGGNVYSSPLFAPAPLRCTIDAVHFRDGSEWTPTGAAQTAALSAPVVQGNGWIGVAMEQTGDGVVAHLLVPGGPARVAGMLQGDVIDRIDDQHVATEAEALSLISEAQPGLRLKITVLRNDGPHDLIVTVGQRPQ